MKALITLLIIIFLGFHSVVFSQSTSGEEPYIPFVDRLELEDSYEITIRSVGCFHNSTHTIRISKDENDFVAFLGENKVGLNSEKLAALRRFEKQLRFIRSGGCTTVDTYILKFGGETLIYNDDTCTHLLGKVLLEELGFTS